MALDEVMSNSSSGTELDESSEKMREDDEAVSSDSNRMIIDESFGLESSRGRSLTGIRNPGSTSEEKKSSSQQTTIMSEAKDKTPDTSEKTDKSQPEAEPLSTRAERRKNEKERKKLNKKKKSDDDDLTCPNKIINRILSKSSFLTANLSHIIEEKFYEAEDYRKELTKIMKDVHYTSTVKDLGDNFSLATSVRPLGWQGTVNLEPSAFLSMNCIHERPPKRERSRPKKSNKKKNTNTNTNNNTNTNTNTNKNPKSATNTNNNINDNQYRHPEQNDKLVEKLSQSLGVQFCQRHNSVECPCVRD